VLLLEIAMTNTTSVALERVTIIGAGRVGRGLAQALAGSGVAVNGPLHRGEWENSIASGDVVIACVPDGEIANVAKQVPVGAIVGHCSGALTLDSLAPHAGFSVHPLLAVTGEATRFAGAAAAVAGANHALLSLAREIAERLGMTPITISDEKRTLYHAAAVAASNYLVALEETAMEIGAEVGLERRHIARLAESALSNWARDGAKSLTGPVVRGDEAVVARQRDAIARSKPALLALWDALTERTRQIAAGMRR
jgi:predicted short-subunit dehydrogenase-like oxidoreductase (DUF2520 family)